MSLDNTGVKHEGTRFVGLDIHRSYATVAAVDSDQQVVLTARRIDYEHFDEWIRKNLRLTDAVTLESTGNAWYFHDLLAPLVASVTVANPIQVALIAKARVKTDPRDALTLARLLWVPPTEVRELRYDICHHEGSLRRQASGSATADPLRPQLQLVRRSPHAIRERAWTQASLLLAQVQASRLSRSLIEASGCRTQLRLLPVRPRQRP
jgi:transposase